MNGITINDKQYIFVESSEDVDYGSCGNCDLYKDRICKCVEICKYFYCLINCSEGDGVFKELKVEK